MQNTLNHETFLSHYEQALGTHEWDAIAPLIHESACFIFSDGTYIGKEAIAHAMRKTFALIQEETYQIDDIRWIHVCADCALCTYIFRWSGKIDGKLSDGKGRGTTLLTKHKDAWKIAHEHLGP